VSTSSFTTFSVPARSRPAASTSGDTIRHGPHQGAQKSTSTGTDAVISAPKRSALASTIQGSLAWQTLQLGTPLLTARTRFLVAQLGQAMTLLMRSDELSLTDTWSL
jgi:hypothetical protein